MSDSFWQSLRADFARKALWELCKYGALALVLAVWGYASADLLATSWSVLGPFRVPVVVTGTIGAAMLAAVVYHRHNRYSPSFGRLDFDFAMASKEIVYQRDGNGRVDYRRKYRLRALKHGLDSFTDKFHWTGDAAPKPEAVRKGQSAYLTIRKNVWQFYEVRLPKTLRRGEEIDVEVVWDIDDRNRNAVPFISSTIEEPTDRLTMTIVLPHDIGVDSVTYEISSGIGARRPFESEIKLLGEDGRVSVETRPLLLHHYELKWFY